MSNKYLVTALALGLLTSVSASAQSFQRKGEKKLYVGSNSTEAKLSFDGVVQYVSSSKKPLERTLRTVIEEQIEHTIGPMSFAEATAVPKGDHVISNVKIASLKGNVMNVSYHYEGTIVLENGPKTAYGIVMPINPRTIYETSMVGEYNPCTDDHYQSEGDFWYFWNPYQSGCKLKEGKDYVVVKGKVERYENTKLSYPEYHNLADEKGNITIHVLFGMDDPELERNPLKSSDTNAENYRVIRGQLMAKGYLPKAWTQKEVKAIAKRVDGDLPFVETLTKGKIVYRFFYGPTGIDEDSLAFHWFYKDAMENSSIMIYSGHSGLGGHLDLDSVEANLGETIKFNTKRYQIFFFDSCTSYKYYNQMYFERKVTAKDPKGTKKLDIFTNGLSTYFHTMPDSNNAIAIAVEKALGYAAAGNGFVSYQTLAKQIDSDNLFGVNGDEDNEAPKAIK
jgi:hypothetical protein